MDFVHDHLATEAKLRVPRVANSFSRYVPVLDPRFSYRGDVLPKFLQMPIGYIGLRRIRGIGYSDQGKPQRPRA